MSLKRLFDMALSSLGIVISLPLWIIFALAIKMEDGGPVFYRQERVGKNKRVFRLFKFRSMIVDAEKETGAVQATEDDPRVLKTGRLLRATAMDELPQLINILKGDMSFVGPRPFVPEWEEQLEAKIPFYSLRHMVKPGLTGWAQINRGYCETVEDNREKLELDLFYIKNLSVPLDLWIVFQTGKIVLLDQWSEQQLQPQSNPQRQSTHAGV